MRLPPLCQKSQKFPFFTKQEKTGGLTTYFGYKKKNSSKKMSEGIGYRTCNEQIKNGLLITVSIKTVKKPLQKT